MELRDWYSLNVPYRNNNSVFYKGFKITKNDDSDYTIEDTRFTDMYTPLSEKDKSILTELGFIKGCDYLMYRRDLKRITLYKNRIKSFQDKIVYHKNKLGTDDQTSFHLKRIRNCNDGIAHFQSLVLQYTARKEDFLNKYELN